MTEHQLLIPNQALPDWKLLFGNCHPVQVEIGPGKGTFLIQMAQDEPQSNFLGIEIRRKRVEKIQANIARLKLPNAQVFMGDARAVITSLFARASVTNFFVHFPDPWTKRRHEKRRLMQADFLAMMHELLVPQGRIYLTTDVQDYSQRFANLFAQHGGFKVIYIEAGHRDYRYHHTLHEENFKAQGRILHYFCFEKI